jgi:aminoglycoside phosphotransferase (APT) family kinase protein
VTLTIDRLGEYVDLAHLASWMDSQDLGRGPLEDMEILSGGTQNVLLKFWRGGRYYVLRRPPRDPYFNGSETMRREARVLGALAASTVPHARLIAACGGEDVLGAAFYLMEPVDGFSPVRGLPELHAHDVKLRHAMGLSLIDALAALRTVPPIPGFGKPEGFLARQVPRLMKQLDSYASYEGWTGRVDLSGIDEAAAWLIANLPRARPPGIVHGDFHMGNAMFSRTGPDVVAVVDWELTTTGDPLCDLGCLLATWADPDGTHPGCISVTPWDGFPTEAELLARYAARTGEAVMDVDWYVAFACFRLAVLVEGTYARAQAGKAEMDTGLWLHETAGNLLKRASARMQAIHHRRTA